jgi:L-fucose isomerase-like protein
MSGLNVSSINSESFAYFFQRIQGNATESPIDTMGDYEPVIGTRINDQMVNFTAGASQITYDGLVTQTFKLSGSFTWEAASTLNNVYKIAFVKNGVTVLAEVRGSLDNSLNWPRNTSLEAVVSLATNDYVECLVTNADGTQNVIVIDMLLVGTIIG